MADFARVTVEGAGKKGQLARDFTKLERRLQDDLNASMRRMVRPVKIAFYQAAPVDTGNLRRNITARLHFRAHQITMTVGTVAEREGFDYTNITRFGHDTPVIVPTHRRALKVHIWGHRTPSVFIFRGAVLGYDPARDWVDEGAFNAIAAATAEGDALTRRVDIHLTEFARPR